MQPILTDANWTTTTFSEIVRNEAAPYQREDQERVRQTGPELNLSAKQALALGMAMHELMTNAVKYGALSVEGGHVVIGTSHDAVDGEDNVRIVWKEYNGPRIEAPPEQTGFGSLVLERVLKSDLSGEINIEYNEEGLCFQVDFNLGESNE